MSFLSGFFSTGGNQQKSSSYTPAQAQWLANTLPTYGSTVGQGQEVYGGDRVAPLTGTQQNTINQAGSWSQYLTPQGSTPIYGQTGQALSGILSGETGADPYTQDSINSIFKMAYEQPAMSQWTQHVQPAIREAYSGPGFWNTNRMQAEAQGAQDLNNWLGQQYGNLIWNAEQANRGFQEARAGRALSAIPLESQYSMEPYAQAQAALSGLGQIYDLGSMGQQQQQAEINAEMAKFIEENRLTDPENLQALLSLLGMNYSTSKGEQRGANLGGRWLQNAFPVMG